MHEIKPLTSLRGLAAFLVFMYHYAFLFPPATRGVVGTPAVPFLPLWQQGQVGVSIFFVLSGFLITRIYWEACVRHTVSLRLFFVKRIARIWPLFLVFAAVEHIAKLARGVHPDATWLVTCSMTQGFFHELRYAGLPTAWSLTIEESFYALAPAIFLAIGAIAWRDQRWREPLNARRVTGLVVALGTIALVLGAAGAAISTVAARTPLGWQGFFTPHDHWLHATLNGRFPEFALGALAAFVHRDPRFAAWVTPRRGFWLALLCFVGIGAAMVAKNTTGPVVTLALTYAIAAQAAALILGLCAPDNPIHAALSTRVAVFAGKISYGLYLVQLTVMMTPLLAITDRLGHFRMPALYLLASAFCGLVYTVIEVPARRAIVNRWGQPTAVVAKQP